MSRFAFGRAAIRIPRPVRSHVPVVADGTREAAEIERDYEIPSEGFCHECEAMVDEAAGKLHRANCKVAPERRRAS